MADAGILARLAGLGITGARATTLANEMDPSQVSLVTDQILAVMVAGRESGSSITASGLVAIKGGTIP